jgi:hypothetical protein
VDIGKPVEDTAATITAINTALVVPDEHEVRWYCYTDAIDEYSGRPDSDDPATSTPPAPSVPRTGNEVDTTTTFVYNYHYKKWCVHTDPAIALESVLFENRPTFMSALFFNPYQAADLPEYWESDTTNKLKIRTPWVRVNQLQSFGRISELTFLGKYLSSWKDAGSGTQAGDVSVRLRYDYEDWDGAEQYTDYRLRANRGELTSFHDGSGKPAGRMQFSIAPGRPKCQAVQVELTEVDSEKVDITEPDYAPGRGWVIEGMDVVYTPRLGTGSKSIGQQSSK